MGLVELFKSVSPTIEHYIQPQMMGHKSSSATLRIRLGSYSKWVLNHKDDPKGSVDSQSGRVLRSQIYNLNLDLVVYCKMGLTCMRVRCTLN